MSALDFLTERGFAARISGNKVSISPSTSAGTASNCSPNWARWMAKRAACTGRSRWAASRSAR